MSTPTRADEERMLFAILLECLCQQIEMLDQPEKEYAKKWLDQALLKNARKVSKDLKKNMDPLTVMLFESMYDYLYMTARDAAQVDANDVDEFRKLVRDFVEKKNAERRASIFLVT